MFASSSSSYSPFPQNTLARLPIAPNPRVINTCGQTPRFAVFWPQLSPLTTFRISTYRSVSKHATSSPLDSAVTRKGGRGTPPGARAMPITSHNNSCFGVFTPLYDGNGYDGIEENHAANYSSSSAAVSKSRNDGGNSRSVSGPRGKAQS